jgi:hypothetical protein
MPDFPATIFCQAWATPTPTGETMPKPVTTTLRLVKLDSTYEGKMNQKRPITLDVR